MSIPYRFMRPPGAPHSFRMVVPSALPAGMQNLRAHVRMRIASCREVECPDEGQCRRFHKLPSWERPTYEYRTGNINRVVTEDEFVQRLHEGTETLVHIIERGL